MGHPQRDDLKNAPAGSLAFLQQFDGSDLQGIALNASRNVHTKVIFLVGCFESVGDLGVSLGIELQKLLVLW
jgi:hypothetical protein